MSELKTQKKPFRSNLREAWPTALFLLGLSLLLTLIPTVYNLLPTPGGRVLVFLLMLAASIAIAVFLLRYLYTKIHEESPERGDLGFTILATVLSFLAVLLLATVLTALLLWVFRIPVSEAPGFGAETIAGLALNALLFPVLISVPMAALTVVRYREGFWKTFGAMVKKNYLVLLGAAALCFGANFGLGLILPPWLTTVLSVLVTTVLLTFAVQVLTENRD